MAETKKEKGCENVVLKVYIHCQGCAQEVTSCLRGFEGVLNVKIENNNVIVEGQNMDPVKITNRVKKKFSKYVELISPLPKPDDDKTKTKKQEEKPEVVKTVEFKTRIHCDGCVREIKNYLETMPGIMWAEPDLKSSKVKVRGDFDETELVKKLSNRLHRQVEILKEEKPKETATEEDTKSEVMIVHYPCHCCHQCRGGGYNYPPPPYYNDPLQTFSDENPNACFII